MPGCFELFASAGHGEFMGQPTRAPVIAFLEAQMKPPQVRARASRQLELIMLLANLLLATI